MKIKLAILDPCKKKLNRIVTAFSNKYDDKLEVYSFTDLNVALQNIRKNRIRVFLADRSYGIDNSGMDYCGFAYLSETKSNQDGEGARSICIFDKTEDIYKQILDIYMSVGGEWGYRHDGDGSSRMIAFCSAGGGVGASSLAAACAVRCASRHKRTLYLNLEKLGDPGLFFDAQGEHTMSDVIYALKGKKNTLNMKLASTVRHASNGVYFYAAPRVALDMIELSNDEVMKLLEELKKHCEYDYIILDIDFSLDDGTIQMFRETDIVVMVTDGTENSNRKTELAYRAMAELEQSRELYLTERLCLLYNRGNSRTARELNLSELRLLGKYPTIANADTKQVVQTLAQSDIFDQIL